MFVPNLRINDLRIWETHMTLSDLKAVSHMMMDKEEVWPREVSDLAYNKRARTDVRSTLHYRNELRGFCVHSTGWDEWWEIDLEEISVVSDIFLMARDSTKVPRLLTIKVSEGSSEPDALACVERRAFSWPTTRFFCRPHLKGRFVRITNMDAGTTIAFCMVEIRGFKYPGYVVVNATLPQLGPYRYNTSYVLPFKNCLTFAFIINGSYPGRLNVYSSGYQGKERLVWRVAGSQGDNWRQGRVLIEGDGIFKVIFEAKAEMDSEIYFDNITLSRDVNCTHAPEHAVHRLLGIQSRVIDRPFYRERLEQMLSRAGFGRKLWKPCYRALEHGWNASNLHKQCDNKGPLIILLRQSNLLFGGFTGATMTDFAPGYNLAYKRPTKQSSTWGSSSMYKSSHATDGRRDTVSHTADDDLVPWLQIDLLAEMLIYKISLVNRDSYLDRLRDIDIRIGSNEEFLSNPKCGDTIKTALPLDSSFDCTPPMKGQFVSINKTGVHLSLGEVKVYGYRPIPSEAAFLFQLNENQISKVKQNQTHFASFYYPRGVMFGAADLRVDLGTRQASIGQDLGALAYDDTQTKTLDLSDVEVLAIEETMCDPPCLRGEQCDEELGVCVCDDSKRDVEWCNKKRELYTKREDYCRAICGSVRCYPRHDTNVHSEEDKWRCFTEESLTSDRQSYNKSSNSTKYYTRDEELRNFGKVSAAYYWSFDDRSDVKELNNANEHWTEAPTAQSSKGILNGAVAFNGSSLKPTILLQQPQEPMHCLYNQLSPCSGGITFSMWLKIKPKPHQVFLSTTSALEDRGFRIVGQAQDGLSLVAVSIIGDLHFVEKKAKFPSLIWTHLIVKYIYKGFEELVKSLELFIDGTIVTEFVSNYISLEKITPDVFPSYISIGEADASYDELLIFMRALPASEIENLYQYYKGAPNLIVKTTIGSTKPWQVEYLNKYSELSKAFAREVSDELSIQNDTRQEITRMWNEGGKIWFSYLLNYNRTGYSTVAPLLESIKKSSTFHLIDIDVNDVYITPLKLSAVNSTSYSNVTLIAKWESSRNLSHGILAGYEVIYSSLENSNTSLLKVDNSSAVVPLTVTDLKPCTVYAFCVRPNTLEGTGALSDTIYVMTKCGPPLAAPNGLQGAAINSTSIQVQWSPIPDSQLQGPLRGYNISYDPVNQEPVQITVPPSTTMIVIHGLMKYTTYRLKISGVSNDQEMGPESFYINVTTQQDAPSAAPESIQANIINSTSVRIYWEPPVNTEQNGIILGYKIFIKETIQSNKTRSFSSCYTVQQIDHLNKFSQYNVQVAAFTSKGYGPWGLISLRTAEDVPTASPNITEAYNTSSTSIFVRWSEPPAHLLHGVLRGYLMRYGLRSSDESQKSIIFMQCQMFMNVTELEKHEEYEFSIAAVTSAGVGPFSEHMYVFTDSDKPEGTIQNLTVNSLSDPRSIKFNIQPMSKKDANGDILGYNLYIYDKLRNKTTVVSVNSSSAQEINYLSPYTDYEIRIAAFTSNGEGNKSEPFQVKTSEDAPSKPPEEVKVKNTSSTGLAVTCISPDKEHLNGILRAYVLLLWETLDRANTERNFTIRVPASQRKRRAVDESGSATFEINGLKKYTEYSVQVLAVTVKEGVPTIAFNITTDEDVPDEPPTNITTFNTSSTSIHVAWGPVPEGHHNGIILGYKVFFKINASTESINNVIISNASQLNIEISGLGKYELYSIWILAFTVKGNGNVSTPVYCRTDEDAPEGVPGNVTSQETVPTGVKVNWLPVKKDLENGIILGYHIALYTISGVFLKNTTVHDSHSLTADLDDLDIWTNYTVSLSAFTRVGTGPWSQRYLVTSGEQEPQDAPANITATAESSTSIRVRWDPIDPSRTRGIHRGYRVCYQASNTPFPDPLLNVTVESSATEVLLVDLYKYVRYSIYAVAFTDKDGKLSNTLTLYTLEDVPDRPPQTITFSFPSPTSLGLEWDPVSFGYQNGIIEGYKITWSRGNLTKKMDLHHGNRFTTIDGLESYKWYNISISAYTSVGEGVAFKERVLTNENNPCLAPQQLLAENHSTPHSIPLKWQPIPAHCVQGILLGYRVRYKPVSAGDTTITKKTIEGERVVGDSELSVVLQNLDVFTRYRIEVVGFTERGEGPAAITFGETCRCNHRLSTSWMEFAPYTVFNKSTNHLTGLMPQVIESMVSECCRTCASHGPSYVDFEYNGANTSSRVETETSLRASIDGTTDLSFPIAGYTLQTEYKSTNGYAGIIKTSGVAFLLSLSKADSSHSVMSAVTDNWPLILVCICSAYIMGCVIWYLDPDNKDFPDSFIAGSMEGFWWAYVSMTTVGYGDRSPVSPKARLISIAWTLAGVVVIGIIVGSIATSLSTITIKQASSLYGLRVASIKNSYEYRFGLRRNAVVDVGRDYQTFDKIYEDLVSGYVGGALLDSLALSSRKDLFEKPFIRVHKVYDVSFVRGVVTSGDTTKLTKCIHRYMTSHAQDISNSVKEAAIPVEVSSEPLATELSSSLFDSSSELFKNSILYISCLLIAAILLGLAWEVYYRRTRQKNAIKETSLFAYRRVLREEMQKVVCSFHDRMERVLNDIREKHELEKKCYVKQMKEYLKAEQKEENARSNEQARALAEQQIKLKYQLDDKSGPVALSEA
ncbi:uncharacterized protein LOC5510390 isoform X2 [Nematostella vectensis]|uniref:uncharacterized protein LOC5510390 isoform X2 n=1 Tax=Nematostella vectensis TaxID=45351 RepID=UPI00207716C2|nr:uncharacterized protein LOC5510390 isoform X2 [Nematostella vectensis]